MFVKKMNMRFYSPKINDDALFNNRSKISAFLLKPLKSMLNPKVYRLYPQQLEHKMYCTDYPVDYSFLEIGYCGHPNFPYSDIQLKKATNLILSHFRKNTIHSFMIH